MKKLKNKTVLITGNLSGVGKACALAAIREGANVVIADVNSNMAEISVAEIKAEDSQTLFIPCDISNFDEVKKLVKKVVNTYNTIDVALNNSTIECQTKKNGNMNKEEWLKVIGLNLNGVFNCMSHELPVMEEQRNGIILNMASIIGESSFANSSHYIATKHGIIGLTKSAALEYARHGIRINALCPGVIDEEISDNTNERKMFKFKVLQNFNEHAIMKKEEEIANGFIFMASEKSPFVTGTAVEIDGGYLSQ